MTAIVGPYNQAPNPANVLLGRGKVFLDNLDALGNRTGMQDLGNCTAVQTENKVEIKEKYESMDPASSLYARGVTRQTVSIKITGDEFTLDNIARAMLGVVQQVTGPGATVAAEAFTAGSPNGIIQGRYYPLAHRNITTLTDVKTGSTSGVLGTDYTIDLLRGIVYVIPGSTLFAAGVQLTADYVYGSYTYNAVRVAAVGTVEAYLRFEGNPIKGPTYEAEYWHVSFTPSGELGLIADDFGNWTLEGEVIADPVNHPTQPIGRIIQTA